MSPVLKVASVLFLTAACAAFPEGFDFNLEPKVGIFEDIINKSVECVRGVLHNGIPDLDFPPLDPMRFHNFPINLDRLNIPFLIRGYINNTDVTMDKVSDWKMTSIKAKVKLIPLTYAVNFSLHYDSIVGTANYEGNVTALFKNVYGKGKIYLESKDVVVSGSVKAVIQGGSVHIKEFAAPITIGNQIVNITGIDGDEEFSKKVSEELSKKVPEIVNNHPELFTKMISPILMYVFDELVNNHAGVGIVKRMVKMCIIDVINPPHF